MAYYYLMGYTFHMSKIDFLAIGDITVDSFIRITDATVHCEINREQCKLCVDFGEKIPFESVEDVPAVGNAANAAVSAHRLSLSSAVVTDLGNDIGGTACLTQLKKEGVKTDWITEHDGMPTNHHFVLWYDDERTILVRHTPYPYKLPKLPDCAWLYLTSIGGDSEAYHQEIAAHLEKNPGIKLVFQPGTFQIKSGIEKMAAFYKRAEVVAVNATEAGRIIGGTLTIPDLLSEMHKLGPKIVLITDGREGAYISDGSERWHLPIYPDARPPLQRTGAGDATTSTFVSFLSLGLSPIEALKRGHINARSVVQNVGAQKGLLTKEEIEKALKEAPPEFVADKI